MTALRTPLGLVLAVSLSSACAAAAPEPPALDGTAWVLAALPGRALVAGSTVTLRFEGGRVLGTDGCNRYTAAYTTAGTALHVDPKAAATMMACPTGLMDQASAYMGALGKAASWRIAAGSLTLFDVGGAALLTFVAEKQSLAGTSWKVTGYNNGKQAVVSVLASATPTLEFSADGKLAGWAGCNRYSASYTSEGARIALGPMAVAKKACLAPDGVMEQETLFLKALGTAATVRVEAGRLELRTAEGSLAVTAASAAAN
jgi:heat shock protein HslJ